MDRTALPDASLWATHDATQTRSTPRLDAAVAARILLVALALGILAQLLLVEQGFGVNVPLLAGALLGGAWVARPPIARLDPADRWLPVVALVFAVLVAVRSAPSLVAFDLLAALALSGAAVAAVMGVAVTRRAASAIVLLATVFAAGAAAAALRLGPGLEPIRRRFATSRHSTGWPVVRGLLIALPLVLVFGALFASADAVFARLLGDTFTVDVDLDGIVARLLVFTVVAWLAGGLLATAAEPTASERQSGAHLADEVTVVRPRLGIVEGFTVIVVVDLVFALFVALQAPYLFGGQDTLALTGVTYSEYARRGFWELMGASFLAGLLVVGLDALMGRPRSRSLAVAAIGLAVLAGGVLISAAVRLSLYQQAYGWTELRFFVLAGIVWVGLCLAAAAWLIARHTTRWLPHAAVLLGLAVAVVVNLADPQAFVAAQNVDRARHPERIAPGGWSGLDSSYLATLGDDFRADAGGRAADAAGRGPTPPPLRPGPAAPRPRARRPRRGLALVQPRADAGTPGPT